MGEIVSRIKSVCVNCGKPYHRDRATAQCEECQPRDDGQRDMVRGNRHARGYGNTWDRLSKRARKLSPFCEDCGSPNDLTADHSAEAWRRHDAGKVIRLKDISVVCRRCNSERGAARGDRATDEHRRGLPSEHGDA